MQSQNIIFNIISRKKRSRKAKLPRVHESHNAALPLTSPVRYLKGVLSSKCLDLNTRVSSLFFWFSPNIPCISEGLIRVKIKNNHPNENTPDYLFRA